MNMEEKLRAVVEQASADGELWHTIIHGNDATEVPTENGNVPSIAKQLKDVRDYLINGAADYLGNCEALRDEAQTIKEEADVIKSDTQTIKDETLALRNEAEEFKNSSIETFNNIETTTQSSITQVQEEGQSQINLASQQAERAEVAARTAQFMIEELGNASGTISPLSNKVYTANVTGNITFSLPTNIDKSIHNQIKFMLNITSTIPVINWGTTAFYQGAVPDIELGRYVCYFDFDNILNKWVCGAILIEEIIEEEETDAVVE